MKKETRREVLKAVAVAVTAGALPGQEHQHAAGLVQVAGPYTPKVLSKTEMDWVGVIAEMIIPRTDTPGALDAKVPEFIDWFLQKNERTAAGVRRGIEALNKLAGTESSGSFAQLPEPQRLALLTKASQAPEGSDERKAFELFKDLTIEGYYISKEGLLQELGWHGNTFLPKFEGCTHPEHQA